MEEVKFGDFTLAMARLAFDLNLPDERGDGLDGVRHGEDRPISGRPASARRA